MFVICVVLFCLLIFVLHERTLCVLGGKDLPGRNGLGDEQITCEDF